MTDCPSLALAPDLVIGSAQNPKIKHTVRLRQRRHRDRAQETLIEGYRELLRAIEHSFIPKHIYYCPELFLGQNEVALLQQAKRAGVLLYETSESVFRKISYRDRPDGLLAVAPQVRATLGDLPLSDNPLILVAAAIEKPGNLGTILRSAEGAGFDAVIVCDGDTDINNPNVVRASVGTLFIVPVVEASYAEVIAFLRNLNIKIVATSPDASNLYWDCDYSGPSAIVVGSEQLGLSEQWLQEADALAAIPMSGRADSLNVATATTIMMYEAIRQRH